MYNHLPLQGYQEMNSYPHQYFQLKQFMLMFQLKQQYNQTSQNSMVYHTM